MSHKKTRKGGRSWFGKKETKAAAKVVRRQDDKAAWDEAMTPPRHLPDQLGHYHRLRWWA